ncbi:Uma2 family endonuclease [Nonomuraea sp. AD125B]|uniref:Uma2 family endonuclease n=1 Tax=Nonomuraea sp. AD125B TaxID=3242897 RepID=UPI003529BD60
MEPIEPDCPRDSSYTVQDLLTSPDDGKALAYAQARIPVYWRVEPDEGPALYVYELDGDAYGPPAVYRAGSVAELSRPFPLAVDPAAFAA